MNAIHPALVALNEIRSEIRCDPKVPEHYGETLTLAVIRVEQAFEQLFSESPELRSARGLFVERMANRCPECGAHPERRGMGGVVSDVTRMAGLGGRWNDAPTLNASVAQLSRLCARESVWLCESLRASALVSEAFVRSRGASDADIEAGRFVGAFGAIYTRGAT
jgi:hypothetical protein